MSIEACWVEVFSGPLQEFADVVAFRVGGQAVEELLIAVGAARILWRAGALTCFDETMSDRELRHLPLLLEGDPMLPVVAEVIGIGKCADSVKNFVQSDCPLIDDHPIELVLGMGCGVRDAPDVELMQMGICPAHCRLNHVVQLDQRRAAVDPYTPPDRRPDAFKFNAKAIQMCRDVLGFGSSHDDSLSLRQAG